MGLFGSPDLYPYVQIEKKCVACGKMGTGKFCSECGVPYKRHAKYFSTAATIVITMSIVIFSLCFIAGGTNLASLFLSAMIAASVCFFGNLINMILCFFKKRRNRLYLIHALLSLAILFIAFLLYGLICIN